MQVIAVKNTACLFIILNKLKLHSLFFLFLKKQTSFLVSL